MLQKYDLKWVARLLPPVNCYSAHGMERTLGHWVYIDEGVGNMDSPK